jgi:tetratricopeptide (TPR) repeat protein
MPGYAVLVAAVAWWGLALAPSRVQSVAAQSPGAIAAGDRAEAYYQFLLGRHLEKIGEVDAALAAYRRALDLDPDTVELHIELAGLYARLNRAEEALAAGEAALRRDPDNPRAHRVVGLVHAGLAEERRGAGGSSAQAAEHAARAVAHLERALAGGESDARVVLTLGELQLDSGRPDRTIEVVARLVAQDPERIDASLLLARAYAAAGRRGEAIAVLEAAVALEPEFARALVALGELYGQEGRWREAARQFEQAVRSNPRNVALRKRWASALLHADDAAGAAAVLEEIVAGRPTDVEAIYLLGVARQAGGDRQGAVDAFRRAAALAPQEARVAASLASALISAGRLGEAAEVLAAAGEKFPDDLAVLFQQAALFERQRRYGEAERAFRRLIERDARHAPALNYLGYMLAERGERLEESVELIRRALEIDPANPAYLDSLGWAYFKLRRFDLAEPPLKRASEALPTNSVVQDHWGDLLFALGRHQEAIAAWQRALAGDRDGIDPDAIERKIRTARERARRGGR